MQVSLIILVVRLFLFSCDVYNRTILHFPPPLLSLPFSLSSLFLFLSPPKQTVGPSLSPILQMRFSTNTANNFLHDYNLLIICGRDSFEFNDEHRRILKMPTD